MSDEHAEEGRMIAEAVRATFQDAGLAWPPAAGGPMPLDALIGAYNLVHEEVPGLCRAAASAFLSRWGVTWTKVPDPDPLLAGFLYANAAGGYILVRREDLLVRRRFSAAHELGHHRLHLAPELARAGRRDLSLVEGDATIDEEGKATNDVLERQANRFAAQVLMPETVCRALHREYASRFGPAPRFVAFHLASELLVSREAAAWRLHSLGLGPKPGWIARGKAKSRQTGKAARSDPAGAADE